MGENESEKENKGIRDKLTLAQGCYTDTYVVMQWFEIFDMCALFFS